MIAGRRLRTVVPLAALLLSLAASPGHGESWGDSLQIKPIAAPIELRYRPVAQATIVFGRVAIEQVGVRMPAPIVRDTQSMRIAPVGDKFAVTFEPAAAEPGGAGSGPVMPTMRLLISDRGELLDAVVIGEDGAPEEKDGPFLAEIEQSLFLALPRFPDRPVKTGDTLYEYVLDVGYDLGLGSGELPLRVKGTVRGTSDYNGREAVVIEYQGDGRCSCGPLTISEQGYELIDVATGIVLAITSTSRFAGPDGFVRWTTGVETSFR